MVGSGFTNTCAKLEIIPHPLPSLSITTLNVKSFRKSGIELISNNAEEIDHTKHIFF